MSLDLARDWLAENAKDSILSGGGSSGPLSMGGIANYQASDGLVELKVVIHRTLSVVFLVN